MLALIQQSICAIEFIGTTLLGRTTAVEGIRTVRDELLATTDAGREWMSLFERVQAPILAAVLADESLTREAMSLLERGAELIEDDAAVLKRRDVNRGLALLESVADRIASADLRRDVTTVKNRLEKSAGRSTRRILEDLMHDPPRRAGKPRPTTPKT